MLCRRLASRIIAVSAAGGVLACSEDAPVAPDTSGMLRRQHENAFVARVSSYGAEVPLS